MQKTVKKIPLLAMALLLFIFGISFGNVQATESAVTKETAYFGSESYSWELNVDSPIGVYIGSPEAIDSAEMLVVYDPEMLEYVSGGELVKDGQIRVEASNVNAKEFMEMLHFIPLIAGETNITIQEAAVKYGDGDSVPAESVTVDVAVPITDGAALTNIQVNGTSISGFSSEKTNYSINVDAETEKLEIKTSPTDIDVEISDTTLKYGENTISIVTTDSWGWQARYLLTVTRAEPIVVSSEPVQSEAETVPVIQQTIDEAPKSGFGSIIIIVIIVLSIILVLLLAAMIIALFRKKTRRSGKRSHSSAKRKAPIAATHPMERRQAPSEDDLQRVINERTRLIREEENHSGRPVEIAVQHVTMQFKRHQNEASSLKELIIRKIKRQYKYEWFKALDDISFNVYKGEVVGIIGTNGSGKSTILKIISGSLKPTKGDVKVNKSKVQLLTLGTGFDMELTGKENVYLNGAIIGYTKEHIDKHYNEIVEFAELENFMDEKVKNYSSGMVSRLGFSIATARKTPEILILDEVLSVGDMFFRKKSLERVNEMVHSGSTVLIVSHSIAVIKKHCTKAVWIEKGVLQAIGDPNEVCAAYEKMNPNG